MGGKAAATTTSGRTVMNRSNGRRDSHTLRRWTFEEVQTAVPYISSVARSLREHYLVLLGVMKAISVSVILLNGQIHALLSPLSDVQKRLLQLWDLPPDLYEFVTRGFPTPPPNTSEP
jgi:hypothetical protein